LKRYHHNSHALLSLGVFAGLFAGLPASSSAQSVWAESLVGAANIGYYNYWNSSNYSGDNSPATASFSSDFTGLDGAGNTETMSFDGDTVSQAFFGQLHVYTTATLDNSYYNANNPVYYNSDTDTLDPNGSPNSLSSLGFAGFDDTLQFGGNLVTGYQAVYIFHVDGTNSGVGTLADLAVNVTDDPSQSFFDWQNGYSSEDWVTTPFAVNGQNAQEINIQFSDQVVMNTWQLQDGGNYSGTSDFSDTLTLSGIELVDPSGKPFSGWTVTSASGTVYNQVYSTPSPAAFVPFLVALPGLLLRRRNR
jgi:hypothetical protein